MNFQDVVKADTIVTKRGNDAWKAQVLHFMESLNHLSTDEQCKEVYKELEKVAKAGGWKPSNVYMANKSVILRAKRLSVPLLDKDKVRGKSAVQDDCNALEDTSKTPFQKFQKAIEQASAYLDKLEPGQIPAAYMLSKELHAKADGRAATAMEVAKAA
jgi:hypothetical protein